MGSERNRNEFFHFRNFVILFVTLSGMLWSYVVIADSANQHYVYVDQDIWSFLKYLGILLLAVLTWISAQAVSIVKNLVSQLSELNVTAKITQREVVDIRADVQDIKRKLEGHDMRIHELEKSQRN